MPLRAVFVGWVCAAMAGGAAGGERFPFRATIGSDETEVRSGPGDDFYPTAVLRRGDEVEVYRREPGGWYAIRPPQGSFSWVPAEEFKLLEDDVAELVGDEIPSLVGSSLEDARDMSHVNLSRGEQVIVLGSSQADGMRWYKIEPPSGEFRWVHASDLGLEGHAPQRHPPEQSEEKRIKPRPVEPRSTAARESEQWHAAPRDTRQHAPRVATPVQHREVREEDSYEPPIGWVPPSSSRGGGRSRSPQRRPTAYRTGHRFDRSSSVSSSGLAGSSADEVLDGINLALSKMVCRPRDEWSLDRLRDRTKDILREANQPGERGRARRLLERIAQFEDVRRKSLGVSDEKLFMASHAVAAKSESPKPLAMARLSKPRPETKPKPSVLATVDEGRYDGTGKLIPLQKRKSGDPQYLLVDDSGLTRYFVTPAPGVNLRNYRDQYVGITGTRQDDSALGKPHITAQRVKSLSRDRL